MRKIKVFISQAMNGLSDEKILKNRDKLFNRFKNSVINFYDEPVEVILIDSYVHDDPPKDACEPVWYMAKSLEHLSKADVMIFESGAVQNRGCDIERHVCNAYGIPYISLAAINKPVQKIQLEEVLGNICMRKQSLHQLDNDSDK